MNPGPGNSLPTLYDWTTPGMLTRIRAIERRLAPALSRSESAHHVPLAQRYGGVAIFLQTLQRRKAWDSARRREVECIIRALQGNQAVQTEWSRGILRIIKDRLDQPWSRLDPHGSRRSCMSTFVHGIQSVQTEATVDQIRIEELTEMLREQTTRDAQEDFLYPLSRATRKALTWLLNPHLQQWVTEGARILLDPAVPVGGAMDEREEIEEARSPPRRPREEEDRRDPRRGD